MRWPKYWSFSFNISPSKEHQGPISFRIDWLDLLAVQGLSRVFSNTSVQKHKFFGTQLSSWSNSYIIHDHGKSHCFDYKDICWQSDISDFQYAVKVSHSFPSKEQASFDLMAAVTICSDFGAPQNKVCHCFHCFPIYLP